MVFRSNQSKTRQNQSVCSFVGPFQQGTIFCSRLQLVLGEILSQFKPAQKSYPSLLLLILLYQAEKEKLPIAKTMDGLPMTADVMAHHEAGHVVAATVFRIPYLVVRLTPDEKGKIGVDFTRIPWTFPRPIQKLSDLRDEEWLELAQDDAKWEAWQKQENDNFAIFMLAGKAAQIEYAGSARPEDARFDYSFVKHRLPNCFARIEELEMKTTAFVKQHWPGILAIASDLLKRSTLSPNEVEQLIRTSMPEIF
jgi:hypothetical protein